MKSDINVMVVEKPGLTEGRVRPKNGSHDVVPAKKLKRKGEDSFEDTCSSIKDRVL